ncbi:hypothetical protein [Aliiroseovarius sp. F47248L]|uniref:hypothetical protein n=1 Tax=Aliiroseovarius sp. F47248L TaxID=2926420 RepID=UPI001FF3B51D|nr:hypothetical protein [Aliiroseovarius sp. F47248L]MCK0140604.1 hypothetical protein [Aliiroseovarius sp. F47248L]
MRLDFDPEQALVNGIRVVFLDWVDLVTSVTDDIVVSEQESVGQHDFFVRSSFLGCLRPSETPRPMRTK